MINIAFTFPDRQLAAGFYAFGKDVKDLTKPMNKAADIFEKDQEKQFQSQGRSPKWAELSSLTKEIRRAKGESSQRILDVGGDLKRSFTKKNAPGHVRIIEKMGMIVGSDLAIQTKKGRKVLAELHTEGYSVTVTPKMKIYFIKRFGIPLQIGTTLETPKRKVMTVSMQAIKQMMSGVRKHIFDSAGSAFKGLGYVHGGE